MAKKLNRNLVGILTLAFMVLLAVTGFALLASLPGSDPKVYEEDAKKLEGEKKYDLAAATYVRAYQRDSAKNPEYLVKAAHCALEDGKIGGARELLRSALLRNPVLKSALTITTDLEFEIAQKFGSTLQWNRVLSEAQKLAEADPTSPLAQHAMGAALLALVGEDERNREKGNDALKKAIELDPVNVKAVDLLCRQLWTAAEIAKAGGRLDEAEELSKSRDTYIAHALEKCRAGAPDNVPPLLQLQAVFKIVGGKPKDGVADLEKLVSEEVKATDAHRLLAQIYTGFLGSFIPRDYAKAEELLKQALRIQPENGELYVELGRVYKLLREQEKDAEKREALIAAEADLYKAGLENIPRSSHFRKLRNNIARITYFTELFMIDLARADEAKDKDAREAQLKQAEGWIARMKDEIDPDSVDVRFLTANLLASRGELIDATREAEAAERAAGARGHLPLYVLLTELYGRQRQWGAAEQAIKKAIAMNRDAPGLTIRLAEIYLAENKPAEAMALLKPTDVTPSSEYIRNNPGAARLRVEALRQMGQFEQALEESRRSGTTTVGDELREAQLLILAEKFADAEKKLKAVLEQVPDDVNALRALAQLYKDTQRQSDARTLIDGALAKNPDSRFLKLLKLDILEEGGAAAKKERTLQIIQEEKDPFFRAIAQHDFYMLQERGEDDAGEAAIAARKEARKHLDEAEKLKPDNPAVIDRQFRLALIDRDWLRAEKYAKRNADLDLDGTEGTVAMGKIAMAKGEVAQEAGNAEETKQHYEKAVELLRAGLNKYPTNALVWTILAESYQRLGRTADAKTVLMEAIRKDPTNGFANRGLAEISLREGNQEEARKYLAAAEKSLPDDPYVKRQLQILKEQENPRDGIAVRERMRREKPDDTQNLVLLARLYALPDVREFDKAADAYRAAIAAAKNDIGLAFEFANFLGREDVNRPSEGDALLADLMTNEADKSKKAQIAVYLGRFYENQKALATADRHFRLAVSLDPATPILQAAGEYYARTNRFKDAIEYYDRALKQLVDADDPAAEQTRSHIIALCLATGDMDRARPAIDEFIQLYPANQQGMIFEGAYHRIAGDVQQARKSFDAHLEKNPDNAVALWQRGELFRLMGRWQKAIEDLSKAKTFNPAGFNYQHRISLADVLMEIGQPEAALAELRSILDENPNEERVAEALIDLYTRAGPARFQDAETLIYTCMQKHPRDYKWPMLLGRLHEHAKDLNKALQAYQKAADLSRFSRDTVEALFRTCRAAEKPQVIIDYAAEKLSARLLNTMPDALATVAWAFLKTENQEKALEYYDLALLAADRNFSTYTAIVWEIVRAFGKEKALERELKRAAAEPENIERQKVLVHLLQMNDRVPEATEVCRKIGQLATRDSDTIFSLLGQGMLKQRAGDYEGALTLYEATLKEDPDNALALNNLAALLCDELNRPAEALPYAQKARRLQPANQDIVDTLGWALTLNGRTGEALGVLLRSLELNREHVITLYHLGMLHIRRKEYEEAARRLESAKKAAEAQGGSPYLSNIEKALEEVQAALK